MTNPRRAAWLRRGAEGLTIVVSILLALLADAAWDYRRDRLDERQLLTALEIEFTEAWSEVDTDLRAREDLLRQAESLLRARLDPALRPEPDAVQALVVELVNWRFYTPAHAVLDDALSAGRLQLIRSDDVRLALMSYQQARERLPVFEGLERDFVSEQMEPYLTARVALDLIEADGAAHLQRAESERFLGLLTDDTFGSLLQLRVERTRQAIVFAESVQRAIRRVQLALEGREGTSGG